MYEDRRKVLGVLLAIAVIIAVGVTAIVMWATPTDTTHTATRPTHSVTATHSPTPSKYAKHGPSKKVIAKLPPKAKPRPGNSKQSTLIYVVRKGDNLTRIAKWYRVHHYAPLVTWNKSKISNPNLIHVGLHLIVRPGSNKHVKIVSS